MSSIFPGRPARWLAIVAAFAAIPAWATVELRVEARPIEDPIQAFVTVTTGDPPTAVTGLTADDFIVTLDGNIDVPLQPANLTPPPSDSDQKVSVVFAMDFTSSVTDVALTPMRDAVKLFIDKMVAGDFAAVIKFNGSEGVQVVHEFVAIDDGGPNDESLKLEVDADFPFQQGSGSNIFDAAVGAVEQFVALSASLPAGPKAVIIITDGDDTNSTATLPETIATANDNSIPIFSIGVGDQVQDVLNALAVDTGGQYLPTTDDQDIADAYASIQFLLTNEYLITFDPVPAINDCAEHTLAVTVDPHGFDEATFTRRECDTDPNPFSFTSQTGLDTNVTARSNAVTMSGLEAPASVSIDIGSYSIGCGDTTTFTSADGTIADGETICVRHTTASAFSTTKTTTLTIGGGSAEFSTTTRAEGGGGGGGGGGAAGAVELLLALGLLWARRRRIA